MDNNFSLPRCGFPPNTVGGKFSFSDSDFRETKRCNHNASYNSVAEWEGVKLSLSIDSWISPYFEFLKTFASLAKVAAQNYNQMCKEIPVFSNEHLFFTCKKIKEAKIKYCNWLEGNFDDLSKNKGTNEFFNKAHQIDRNVGKFLAMKYDAQNNPLYVQSGLVSKLNALMEYSAFVEDAGKFFEKPLKYSISNNHASFTLEQDDLSNFLKGRRVNNVLQNYFYPFMYYEGISADDANKLAECKKDFWQQVKEKIVIKRSVILNENKSCSFKLFMNTLRNYAREDFEALQAEIQSCRRAMSFFIDLFRYDRPISYPIYIEKFCYDLALEIECDEPEANSFVFPKYSLSGVLSCKQIYDAFKKGFIKLQMDWIEKEKEDFSSQEEFETFWNKNQEELSIFVEKKLDDVICAKNFLESRLIYLSEWLDDGVAPVISFLNQYTLFVLGKPIDKVKINECSITQPRPL